MSKHKTKRIQRILNKKDQRITQHNFHQNPQQQISNPIKRIDTHPIHLFLSHNPSLGPPYRLLLDTNFINFSIQNKLDIFKASMDCLLGKVNLFVPECVIGELEKLGKNCRIALKLIQDERINKLQCDHKGTYADDCLVNRVKLNRVYIVATCDKDLKRRLRKIEGVPIMYIQSRKYTIERMAEALNAPK